MTQRRPGRPSVPEDEQAVRFNASLSPEELADLDALAKADGLKRSQEIAQLVRKEKKRRRVLAR